MASDALGEYLKKILLDQDFREKVLLNRDESFVGFDLTDEEKDNLQSMGVDFFDKLPEDMKDPAFRVWIGRVFVTTERTVDRVAVSPSWDRSIIDSSAPHIIGMANKVRSCAPNDRKAELVKLLNAIDPIPDDLPKPELTTPSHSGKHPDIYIVGLGINGFDQVTPETRRAISASSETFFIGNGMGTKEYIDSLCPKSTNLISFYAESLNRIESYRNMAMAVIEAALDHPPVTLAEYGHPIIFSMPPFIIESMAKPLGLKVKIYPAVSALDCILAEIMVDPCSDGFLTYEATDMLIRERTILPDVGLLIWQAASVETSLYSSRGSKPERYFNLTNYLLKYYAPDHEVKAVYASNYPLIPSTVYKFPLARLPDFATELHPGFTLYIKPSIHGEVKNYNLAKLSRSVEHLDRISSTSS